MGSDRFVRYCRRREEAALAAHLPGYSSLVTEPPDDLVGFGSTWSQQLFDGDFYRSRSSDELPAVSLVFVQSVDGNTVAINPAVLGGGETDKHLIYEGLSRIDADAVLSGATTARGREMVFSVWHPELVALRTARTRPRHPMQVIVTDRGNLPFDDGLMFQEPELKVALITGTSVAEPLADRLRDRPWIQVIDAGSPISLRLALGRLHQQGVDVISAVGGPTTATALLRAGLVSDIYLTTSAIHAGEPDTPFYQGPPLRLTRVLEKAGKAREAGVRFEHLIVDS